MGSILFDISRLLKGKRTEPATEEEAINQSDEAEAVSGRLAKQGETHLAIDSPSMGPWGHEFEGRPMAQMTHVNFLKYGGSWTEFCRNIGQLPARDREENYHGGKT